MKERYRSIHRYGEAEFEEQKSRFIGYAKPVETEEEAIEFIEEIKELHRTATHNCTAYVVGTNIQRFSDDGEPSHTAGMPMLSLLHKEEIRNVVAVVTRYFGGTLLGKGGLVRAYTEGIRVALEAGIIVDKINHLELEMTIDYTHLGPIDNYMAVNQIHVVDREFLTDVSIRVYIDEMEVEKFKEDMMNLTSGTVVFETVDELYLSVLKGKILI